MKPNRPSTNLRPHSSVVLDGPHRAASRAMLYPVGFTEKDFTKPQIGVASTWSMVTPCNMLPGCLNGRNLDVVSVFEAVGQRAAGKISEKEAHDVEACAIPGPGSCGGMYTANTMASAIEALGMSLPNSSAQAAISEHKRRTVAMRVLPCSTF